MSTPYKDRALEHYDKGWFVFPCQPRGKEPLVKGRSGGYQSIGATREMIEREAQRFDKANIGIRIPEDMIGLDLDLREDADGWASFHTLDLPDTVTLAHNESLYRHHLYRVPDEVTPEDIARLRDNKGGIDLLRWMHRLTVGSGSLHKSGEVYRFSRKGELAGTDAIPRPEQCTALTLEEWERIVEFFGERSHIDGYRVGDVDLDEWLEQHGGEPTEAMKAAFRAWSRRAPDDQRHSAMGLALYRVAQEAEDGETGAQRAIVALRQQFIEAVSDRSSEQEAEDEFDRLLVGAVGKALAKTEAEGRGPAVIEDLVILHPKEPDEGHPSPRKARDEAYACSVNVEPVEFAREYLTRHFSHGDETSVKTLKVVAGQFWRWSDKAHHWVRVEDDRVRGWVMGDLRGQWQIVPSDDGNEQQPIRLKMKNVNEILAALHGLVLDEPETPRGGVPFSDGWLDIETGEISPLTPARWHTWSVPASYNDRTGCKAWLAFLESLGWGEGTEEHRLLRQWFGYLLSGSKAQQKMLLLHGPRRSGKGTILKIARALLGDGATGLQLASLTGEFGLSPLLGKTLAVVGDARFTAKVDKVVVERLLSIIGDDEVLVNIKNKPMVSTRLDARLMMATNERPVFTESSDALAVKFLILHTAVSFLGREDFGLEARLREEIPGIVEWALAGYHDLREVGWFSQTEVGLQMQEDFIRDSAPLRHFVEEECEFGAFKVRNDELYSSYRLWCERGGQHPLNRVHFMRELLTAYEGEITEGRSNGVKVKHGLRLREGR